MIDTHCHLLPGLDDGPQTVDDAIALARRLVEDGISFVLCTPHYSRMFPTSHTNAVDRFAVLQEALAEASLALDVELAAEIGPAFALSSPLEELQRRAVRGRYLLVEVLPDSPGGLFGAVSDRLEEEAGLVPIFAHPERCRAVQRHPTLIEDARRRGALVQIVAPSLIRRWGRGVASAAWGLLGAGWVDLLGSDAHGATRRGVHLAKAVELIRARFGAELARDVVLRNPARVLPR
ncbi:MAG: tyrosine-protein phosphatase [Gaiellaceae bacterium]